jgi:DNA-directed RNA polymerase subunit RPC12/RpoP
MTGTDEVRCPRGHLTSGKFPFCTECGAELNPQGEEGVVRCPNGHAVMGGHRFCIECGAPVEQPGPAGPEPGPVGADDEAASDEVRCPKGHLTPAEYPYCIICGAELEKDEAVAAASPPPSRPARRPARRRQRTIPAVTPDEPASAGERPAEPETTPPPPSQPRRAAPRPRRAPRRVAAPQPGDEPDEAQPLVVDEPEEVAFDEPIAAPVASYASDVSDEATEHFVHTPSAGGRITTRAPGTGGGNDRQRIFIMVGAVVLAIIAAIALVFILKGSGGPAPAPTPAPTAFVTQTSAPTPVSAGPNVDVPMRVVGSSVRPGTAANSYVASASIRNPTDFTARNITVTFTLQDAGGAAIGAVTRQIATLPSGGVAPVEVTGADPGGKRPATVSVRAVAAQIVA